MDKNVGKRVEKPVGKFYVRKIYGKKYYWKKIFYGKISMDHMDQWIGLKEYCTSVLAPYFMRKTMVSVLDFPNKTNPLNENPSMM